jgi:hypothetical protein
MSEIRKGAEKMKGATAITPKSKKQTRKRISSSDSSVAISETSQQSSSLSSLSSPLLTVPIKTLPTKQQTSDNRRAIDEHRIVKPGVSYCLFTF